MLKNKPATGVSINQHSEAGADNNITPNSFGVHGRG
jgi:hypothetical protein